MLDAARAIPARFVYVVSRIGNAILHAVAGFGRFCAFTRDTFIGIMHPKVWLRRSRLGRQFFEVGTLSIPVLALTGAFVGMTLAFEGYRQFQAIGQEGRLGGVINLSIVKQLGPVLAAVMLAGRVGCSLAAELGSMRVTEQLDAMRAMAADPIRVLVVPRFLACVLMIPSLTIVSNMCGVFGSWFVVTRIYNADPAMYLWYSERFVYSIDIFSGLVKSVFFGAAIGLISCYKGFNCKPGAEGVGAATTEAFVTSFLAIIILGMVLAKVTNDIAYWLLGGVSSVFK
ncbi:MAG: ABC transporter permease [Phycisphaeraceae bacterium]|nr:ABC transporter permease [Phycisphaeraceae bacterium]